MNDAKQPTSLRPEAYEAIEETLMDSAQGRWFLSEFARRNRTADTQTVLDAIARLETSMRQRREGTDLIRRDLIEMSEAIARAREELAGIRPPGQADAPAIAAGEEFDAIVLATEIATSQILAPAEVLQEALWKLRAYAPLRPTCDALLAKVMDIITACSFQDLAGQRMDKAVKLLRLLESRVASMIEICGRDDYEDYDIEEIESLDDAPMPPMDGMIEGLDAFEPIEAGDIEMIDMPLTDQSAHGAGEDQIAAAAPGGAYSADVG